MYNVLMDQPSPKHRGIATTPFAALVGIGLSLMEFIRAYPDDAACLDRLWRKRYAPDGHHARCPSASHAQVPPHQDASVLRLRCVQAAPPSHEGHDLRAVHDLAVALVLRDVLDDEPLGADLREAVGARAGRELPTAHRMMKKVRTELMPTSMPTRYRVTWRSTRPPGAASLAAANRVCALDRDRTLASRSHAKTRAVLGMVERGGRLRFRVIPTRYGAPLSKAVFGNGQPEIASSSPTIGLPTSRCSRQLHRPQGHQPLGSASTCAARRYTNTIEGAFGNMKTGMRGVYKKVSPRYLQSYLDEYAWRHNAKREGGPLFEQLLERAALQAP